MHWHHAAFARAWLVAVAMGGCGLLAAQGRKHFTAFDTAYVADYSRILTTRAYISTKFNRLVLGGLQEAKDLEYRPNNRVNFGLGASYHALTLNIGVGIPGVNNNQDKYGTTRYLDAQANIHTRRWATNLFLQGFRGYYISSHAKQELGWVQATTYPTRPDLRQFNVGVSTVHIFNNGRFSYRAAFNQDAWQRRSQGSFLVGGYFTYFHLRADSSLVPEALATDFRADLHLRKGDFLDLGPSAGYAYTLVVHEHWFITGSAVAGVGISAQRTTVVEPDGRTEHKSYTGPAGTASSGPVPATTARATMSGSPSTRRTSVISWRTAATCCGPWATSGSMWPSGSASTWITRGAFGDPAPRAAVRPPAACGRPSCGRSRPAGSCGCAGSWASPPGTRPPRCTPWLLPG